MTSESLLTKVEKVLCCPSGECRALVAGVPQDCGATLTKEHAEAAIAVIQDQNKKQIAALCEIRKAAARATDDPHLTVPIQDSFRSFARVASEALA